MLPFNEKRKSNPRYAKKEKLPTVKQKKCPNCGAPYYATCLNCWYKNTYIVDEPKFMKAKDVKEDKPDEL